MRKLTNIIKVFLLVAPVMALSGGFSSCSDSNEGELFITPSDSLTDLTVIDVMENVNMSHGKYSEWIELLKYTNYYNSLKNANAKATVFCPTNEAIDKFLASRGVSSVAELDIEYAKAVVRSHIINEETITQQEIDKYATDKDYIKTQTLFDSYINLSYGYQKTDVDDADRTDEIFCEDSIFINNDARLGNFDATTCKNGVFYEMADVIKPMAETIYETLKADDDYSIFADAIESCGYDSVANKYADTIYTSSGRIINKYRYTCFAVPNSVYQAEGITSVSSLVSYLRAHSVEDGSLSDNDLLSHYMQYHFLKREYKAEELFDFMDPGNETLIYEVRLPGDAIVTDMIADAKIINKTVPLVRSDIETRNGYINKVGGVMPVYHPDPVNVKWDFLNQENIISFVNGYGASKSLGNLFSSPLESSEYKIDISSTYRDGEFGDVSSAFEYKLGSSRTSASNYRVIGFYKDKYKNASNKETSQYGCYMNNYMCLNLGYAGYIKFNTPSIIKGKYKVILHYLSDAGSQQSLFSGGSLTQFKLDEDSENAKSKSAYLFKGAKFSRNNLFLNLTETLFANVEFDATSTHTFKITMLDIQAKNLSNYHQYLDYVEFEPID